MKTKVVKIGNSRGIRLPKSVIEQSGIKEEVELEVHDDKIIIKSLSAKRKDWDASFKKMAKHNDDLLLDPDTLHDQTEWDKEEWEW